MTVETRLRARVGLKMLRKWEQIIQCRYEIIGMDKMMDLPEESRLKFWSGNSKIISVGYLIAMITDGAMTVCALLAMNVILVWWIAKWKTFLANL